MGETACHEEVNAPSAEKKTRDTDAEVAPSPALARLIEEVRNEQIEGPNAYNRTHNRHNRSR
ncbi:MAG: YhhA family cyclophane-containing RiPP [Acidobacteriota bacterium]